jgi:hypothetical protein
VEKKTEKKMGKKKEKKRLRGLWSAMIVDLFFPFFLKGFGLFVLFSNAQNTAAGVGVAWMDGLP